MSTSPYLGDVLRSRGLRLTAQRQLVLDAIRALGEATPDQVHAAIAEQVSGVNITTVYRTLELLEELRLVRHSHLSHGAVTYRPADADQYVPLVCHECGAVERLAPAVLAGVAEELLRDRGFRLDLWHATLFGTCARCAAPLPGER